jgi:hypothetical protein
LAPWLLGLVVPVQEIFCSALVALVGLVQKISSSPYTISIPFSPPHSKLGRQPALALGRLSLSICLWPRFETGEYYVCVLFALRFKIFGSFLLPQGPFLHSRKN